MTYNFVFPLKTYRVGVDTQKGCDIQPLVDVAHYNNLNTFNNVKDFGLNVPVSGKTQEEYMARLLEANEKREIEIERGKLAVSILKQMNNRSRLLLDAAKFELKSKELELQNIKVDFNGSDNPKSDVA